MSYTGVTMTESLIVDTPGDIGATQWRAAAQEGPQPHTNETEHRFQIWSFLRWHLLALSFYYLHLFQTLDPSISVSATKKSQSLV